MSEVVFVDTSALLTVLDANEARQALATVAWERLMDDAEDGAVTLCSHSGILTESAALVQRRLGMAAVRDLLTEIVPLLDVVWVDGGCTSSPSPPCSPPIAGRSASSTGRRSS